MLKFDEDDGWGSEGGGNGSDPDDSYDDDKWDDVDPTESDSDIMGGEAPDEKQN